MDENELNAQLTEDDTVNVLGGVDESIGETLDDNPANEETPEDAEDEDDDEEDDTDEPFDDEDEI